MIRCFQGAYRCAENLRHILVFHIVEILHIEYKPLLLRQARDSLLQAFCKAVAVYIGLRGYVDSAFVLVQRNSGSLFFAFDEAMLSLMAIL